MKPQDQLVKFMDKKSQLIKNELDPEIPSIADEFFTLEDEKDLLSWDDATALYVMKKISNSLYSEAIEGKAPISDIDICPWCVRFFSRCGFCDYGKRHGVCLCPDENLYETICEFLSDNSICASISLKTLYYVIATKEN